MLNVCLFQKCARPVPLSVFCVSNSCVSCHSSLCCLHVIFSCQKNRISFKIMFLCPDSFNLKLNEVKSSLLKDEWFYCEKSLWPFSLCIVSWSCLVQMYKFIFSATPTGFWCLIISNLLYLQISLNGFCFISGWIFEVTAEKSYLWIIIRK